MDDPNDEFEQHQHELDGLRIQQVVRARRAAMRAGSYCIIGAIASAVVAVDLGWLALESARVHQLMTSAIYSLVAIAFVSAIPGLRRRAIEFRREARKKSLPEPATPPDLSTLCDGSQIVSNLEKMK